MGLGEYNLHYDKKFDDAFAWFLNGVNIALVPSTTSTPVKMTTVNAQTNAAYFVSKALPNALYPQFEADGLTESLTAVGVAHSGVDHLKLAIADAGIAGWDSWVLLAKSPFCTHCTHSVAQCVLARLHGQGAHGGGCHRQSKKDPASIVISRDALQTHLDHVCLWSQ